MKLFWWRKSTSQRKQTFLTLRGNKSDGIKKGKEREYWAEAGRQEASLVKDREGPSSR